MWQAYMVALLLMAGTFSAARPAPEPQGASGDPVQAARAYCQVLMASDLSTLAGHLSKETNTRLGMGAQELGVAVGRHMAEDWHPVSVEALGPVRKGPSGSVTVPAKLRVEQGTGDTKRSRVFTQDLHLRQEGMDWKVCWDDGMVSLVRRLAVDGPALEYSTARRAKDWKTVAALFTDDALRALCGDGPAAEALKQAGEKQERDWGTFIKADGFQMRRSGDATAEGQWVLEFRRAPQLPEVGDDVTVVARVRCRLDVNRGRWLVDRFEVTHVNRAPARGDPASNASGSESAKPAVPSAGPATGQ